MRIEAYTYDADVHCESCALKRFGADPECGWCPELTVLVREDAEDSEGNPVHPVFDGGCAEAGWTHCGTCGEEL